MWTERRSDANEPFFIFSPWCPADRVQHRLIPCYVWSSRTPQLCLSLVNCYQLSSYYKPPAIYWGTLNIVSGAQPPWSHEDFDDFFRNLVLSERVPGSGYTIKWSFWCSGCSLLCDVCWSSLGDGWQIQGWLWSNCGTRGNHVCVGHAGTINMPFPLSCWIFCRHRGIKLKGGNA